MGYGFGSRIDCDESLLFFFLLLVIVFCSCGLFDDGDELLFFFLLLIVLFCSGCGIGFFRTSSAEK